MEEKPTRKAKHITKRDPSVARQVTVYMLKFLVLLQVVPHCVTKRIQIISNKSLGTADSIILASGFQLYFTYRVLGVFTQN